MPQMSLEFVHGDASGSCPSAEGLPQIVEATAPGPEGGGFDPTKYPVETAHQLTGFPRLDPGVDREQAMRIDKQVRAKVRSDL